MVYAGQTGDTGQTSGQSRSGYGEQDFEDSRNTLRGAHSEVIVHQNPPNQEESKKSRKNSSHPRAPKTPKSSPLTHGFGMGIKGKRTTKVHTYIPCQIPKSKVPKMHQEIHQEWAPKITTKNKLEQHNQALRNHTKSSIHTKEVHTRSSLPPDNPTLSQDLTMKLSR
jgi:hypothetical protein